MRSPNTLLPPYIHAGASGGAWPPVAGSEAAARAPGPSGAGRPSSGGSTGEGLVSPPSQQVFAKLPPSKAGL